jgi:hypothetical protein
MKMNWIGALALAAVSLAPVASFADRYDDYYRDGRRHDNNAFQRGVDRGQEEGRKDGWNDGRQRERFNIFGQRDYHNGDAGYKRWYGPRSEYVEGFRRGYEESYRQAYRSAATRYHRGWRWNEDRRDSRRW